MSSEDDDDSVLSEPVDLNISNDHYYQPATNLTNGQVPNGASNSPTSTQDIPKSEQKYSYNHEIFCNNQEIPVYGSKTILHSLPAYDLWRPLYPTYLSEEKFRNFHRPKLRHYNTGAQAIYNKRNIRLKPFPIKNLCKTLYSFQKRLRTKVIRAINQGRSRQEIVDNFLLIKHAKDLTAKQGELFLFEYSEEFPPVLSQIGMASNIKNIYVTDSANKKTSRNANSTLLNKSPNSQKSQDAHKNGNYKIGIDQDVNDRLTREKIYFSDPKPGVEFKVIENNLYRAPIYQHEESGCDFLLIRTRNGIYIRLIKNIFTVGQTMPRNAIPQPSDSSITRFRCDFSNNYIHRLFRESQTIPLSLDFSVLLKLFPDYSPMILKRRMTTNGAKYYDGQFLAGTSNYGLITLKLLRRSFTPEQYCLNMSMLAARERLRELNYTESMINTKSDVEQEVEVQAAPWNTSRAVLGATVGRHFLDFKAHLIDPTGQRREGFSCVPWIRSPTEEAQLKERKMQKSTTGTLDTPSLPNAPVQMKNPLATKIRGEKLERLNIYRKEAQIITQIQAKALSCPDPLSSDEGSTDEGEEDEEDARDLDKLVTENKTFQQLSDEKEEEELRQFRKEFNSFGLTNGNGVEKGSQPSHEKSSKWPKNVDTFKNKVLRIIRAYDTPEGVIHRTEIVREPAIIARYVEERRGKSTDSGINMDTGISLNVPSNNSNGLDSYQDASLQNRRSSFSLGQGELCRADGMVLTISKKVLDPRNMRLNHRLTRTCQKF